MKRISLVLVLVLVPFAAVASAQQKGTKPAGKKTTPQQLTLPPDAQEVEPNTYRHTDAKGKVWIYRKTPFGLVRFAENAEPESAQAKKGKGAASHARMPNGPPAGAQQLDEYSYRHVDAKGVIWLYRRTPFGWSKGIEPPAEPGGAATQESKPPEEKKIKVVDQGDSLLFESTSPLGTNRWVRKKTSLTPEEKAAWEKMRSPDTGAVAAADKQN